MTIAILYMKSDQIGYGHYKRCAVLAEALMQLGMSIEMMEYYPDDQDFASILSHIEYSRPQKIVVDMPSEYYHGDFLQTIRAWNIELVIVQDEGQFEGISCDTLIACSARFNNQPIPGEHLLSGTDYVILDSQFHRYHTMDRSINEHVNHMLISFGGTDPKFISKQVMAWIRYMTFPNPVHIDVIMGANRSRFPESIGNDFPGSYRIWGHVDDMPNRLWNTDLCIISGGMTMYEACCLGTPAIILNQNEEQWQEAELFASSGAVLNLGYPEDLQLETFRNAVGSLQLPSFRNELSKQAKAMVDGSGAYRIARYLAGQ